jgi:GntR family transcriptional regulator / MocR family aminotransferase
VARRSTIEAPVAVAPDPRSGDPLHRQPYEELREAVLSGRLPAGTRLPSSRTLASELGVSEPPPSSGPAGHR